MITIPGCELQNSCNPWCRTVIRADSYNRGRELGYVYNFSVPNLGYFGTT